MHEFTQDAFAYVRHYGRLDLFITFTCSPAWDDIQQVLLPGKSSVDRHDITACVFRQKLKSLIDFIVKQSIWVCVLLDVLSGMAKERITTLTHTNLAL